MFEKIKNKKGMKLKCFTIITISNGGFDNPDEVEESHLYFASEQEAIGYLKSQEHEETFTNFHGEDVLQAYRVEGNSLLLYVQVDKEDLDLYNIKEEDIDCHDKDGSAPRFKRINGVICEICYPDWGEIFSEVIPGAITLNESLVAIIQMERLGL